MLNQGRISIYLIALVFFTGVMVLGFSKVSVASAPPQPIAGETFPEWQYQVWSEADGYASARVNYQADTPQALQRYVELNKSLAAQLRQENVQEFDVSVTFKRPLSLNELRDWATASRLNVTSFTLRVMAKDGSRVTVGGPTDGQLVDDTHLKRILDRVAEHGATDVRGFISVEGTVAANDYDQVAASKEVFLIDVTRSVVRQHLAKAKTALPVPLSSLSILLPPTFPRMEDLGLVNSR